MFFVRMDEPETNSMTFPHLFVFSLPGAAPTGSRHSNRTQPCWEDILS